MRAAVARSDGIYIYIDETRSSAAIPFFIALFVNAWHHVHGTCLAGTYSSRGLLWNIYSIAIFVCGWLANNIR